MRSRSLRPRVLLLGACALAVVGGALAWVVQRADGTVGGARVARPRVLAQGPSAPDLSRAPRADAQEGVGLATPDAMPRELGYVPPPPDTLAAVAGQVVDARTGLALPGITVTFLSRRPKTARATSDALGNFTTGVEIASGVVSVVHTSDPAKPRFAARWSIQPEQFLLPPAGTSGADEPFRIVLRASAPETELDIDVTLPDGRPAAGASVALTIGDRDARGGFQGSSRVYEVVDARGRARFALFGDDGWSRSFRAEAEHGEDLASDVLDIDPPIGRAVRRLELAPGASVRVRATNDEGRPVAGVSLWIASGEGGRFVTGRRGATDARGEATFTGLRAGCWTITALHPLTGRATSQQLDLLRGAHAEAGFELGVSGLRLGLAGTVLDEEGFPLAGVDVRLQVPGEEPVELETSEVGAFELWSRVASGVAVRVGGGFLDDRFEPSFLTLPFGTTGFEARRLARVEPETRTFVVVDAVTKKPAARATIVLHHAAQSGAFPEGALRVAAPSGFAQATFKLRADTRWVVDAPGYLRAEGSLGELVERCGPNPLPLSIALDPGFERRLEVRDRATGARLAGASFQSDGRVLGASGEDGVVELHGPAWPVTVHVVCTGYQPLEWDPATLAWPDDVVWLEPQR